jgi:hypothetical protein
VLLVSHIERFQEDASASEFYTIRECAKTYSKVSAYLSATASVAPQGVIPTQPAQRNEASQ